MFYCFGKRRKEKVNNQDVPDCPTTSSVSDPAEKKAKKTRWFSKLVRCVKTTGNRVVPTDEDTEEIVDTGCEDLEIPIFETATAESVNKRDHEASPATNPAGTKESTEAAEVTETTGKTRTTDTTEKKRKTPWWRRLLPCLRKNKVEPLEDTDGATSLSCSDDDKSDEKPIAVVPAEKESRQSSPVGHGGLLQVKPKPTRIRTLCNEELVCFGFPNLSQTCYMNATLQGLLTLTDFVQEVLDQEQLWSLHWGSKIIRGFSNIVISRFSNDRMMKRLVLTGLKKTVAEFNSEFRDNSQKDAHEFLCSLLNMIKAPALDLHSEAALMGMLYTCPVGAHICFKMLSTRTCKGCGSQSTREEEFLNLSLDAVPAGSVSQCLHEYLKEGKLDFRCPCGAGESTERVSFLTLPNVLILQLKRFRFTETFRLEKVNTPVQLSREVVVNPENTVNAQTGTRYSLVSIVSHLGSTAHCGHYVCDGAHRPQEPGDTSDRWLTYDDERVTVTTGESACHLRQSFAYLLCYEKQQ